MSEQTYTELEVKVFNFLAEEMLGNGIYDTREIAKILKLPVKTVKGVLGSLTKKGKVDCDDEPGQPQVVWPVHPTAGSCFWADELSEEEIRAAFLSTPGA